MSKLYAKMTADDRVPVTRQANLNAEAWVQTECGRITVSLNANGNYVIHMQPVRDHVVRASDIVVVESGNLNSLFEGME